MAHKYFLIIYIMLMGKDSISLIFYIWRFRDTGRLSDWPKVAQLGSGRSAPEIKAFFPYSKVTDCFFQY